MKDGFESLGRVRAQGIVLLLLTFVVGGLAGMTLERVRTVRRFERPGPPDFGMMRPRNRGELPPMFDRLNLSEEQRTQITDIMEAGRPRTEAVLDDMLPRLRAVMDSVRVELHAVLTPEQATQLDSLMAEMRHPRGRWGRGMPGRGPGMLLPPGR